MISFKLQNIKYAEMTYVKMGARSLLGYMKMIGQTLLGYEIGWSNFARM